VAGGRHPIAEVGAQKKGSPLASGITEIACGETECLGWIGPRV
jgi:hypothetical protein